jgi:hypothetical protein
MALALEHASSELEQTNAIKHLLYKPPAATVIATLATLQQETTQPTAIQLLYIATDYDVIHASNSSLSATNTSMPSDIEAAHLVSGVHLPGRSGSRSTAAQNILHPRDLCFAFKQPTLLVLDAQAGALGFDALLDLGPSLLLTSPQAWQGQSRRSGSVFTLLLTQPVAGLVRLCRGDKPALRDSELEVGEEVWERMIAAAIPRVEGASRWHDGLDMTMDMDDCNLNPIGIDTLLQDSFVCTLVTRVLLVRCTLLHLEVESEALPQVCQGNGGAVRFADG